MKRGCRRWRQQRNFGVALCRRSTVRACRRVVLDCWRWQAVGGCRVKPRQRDVCLPRCGRRRYDGCGVPVHAARRDRVLPFLQLHVGRARSAGELGRDGGRDGGSVEHEAVRLVSGMCMVVWRLRRR